MTAKDAIKMIEKDGWYWDRTRGSHKVFKHPTKKGITVIPEHKGDLAPGTLNFILKQAGLK